MSHFIIPGFESSLSFRPDSYWEHDNPVSAIVSNVKGTYRRQRITEILTYESKGHELVEPLPWLANHPEFYEDDPGDGIPRRLAGIHPTLMGGEFLPTYFPGEVEIARIELESTTADVCSIRARRRSRGSKILYRVVDEYPEYGGWKLRVRSSSRPLTFRRMVELIDTAVSPFTDPECRDLTDAMRDNAGDELDLAGSFVSVSSHFYPDLEAYYERKAELWHQARLEQMEEEDQDNAE
jgi:hypothetical protein